MVGAYWTHPRTHAPTTHHQHPPSIHRPTPWPNPNPRQRFFFITCAFCLSRVFFVCQLCTQHMRWVFCFSCSEDGAPRAAACGGGWVVRVPGAPPLRSFSRLACFRPHSYLLTPKPCPHPCPNPCRVFHVWAHGPGRVCFPVPVHQCQLTAVNSPLPNPTLLPIDLVTRRPTTTPRSSPLPSPPARSPDGGSFCRACRACLPRPSPGAGHMEGAARRGQAAQGRPRRRRGSGLPRGGQERGRERRPGGGGIAGRRSPGRGAGDWRVLRPLLQSLSLSLRTLQCRNPESSLLLSHQTRHSLFLSCTPSSLRPFILSRLPSSPPACLPACTPARLHACFSLPCLEGRGGHAASRRHLGDAHLPGRRHAPRGGVMAAVLRADGRWVGDDLDTKHTTKHTPSTSRRASLANRVAGPG